MGKSRISSKERQRRCRARMEREARRAVTSDLPRLDMAERTAAGLRFAPHWLRKAILERDGYRCRYCGALVTNETANIDHVTPYPEGLTTKQNLVTACQPCNHRKGSSTKMKPRRLRG